MRYAIELSRDDNNSWLVTSPDFPELTTFGKTPALATKQAGKALVGMLGQYMDRGLDIPSPRTTRGRSAVTLPPVISAKVALYQAMRDAGINNSTLARKLDVTEAIVRRLIDPVHASRIEKLDEALRVLGYAVDVTVRKVA